MDLKKKKDGRLKCNLLQLPSQGKSEVEENGAVEIARCFRGQYFGELALVTNKPRAASAHAIGTVKCLGRASGGPVMSALEALKSYGALLGSQVPKSSQKYDQGLDLL